MDINLSVFNGFFDIGMAFGLILIYNTAYYTYVTTRKKKMLIHALAFLGAAVFDLLSFITIAFSQMTEGMDLLQLGNLLGNVNLLILFSALIWANTQPEEALVSTNRKSWFAILPIVIGVFFMSLVLLLKVVVIKSGASNWIGPLGVGLSYLVCLELIFTMILSMRQFYSDHNENHVKMISAYVLLLMAMLYNNFISQYGQLAMTLNYIYQLFAIGILLKYTYRLYIGNPLKEILRREEQVHVFAKNIETVIRKKTNEVSEINKRFLVELEYAKSIQQSLLPPGRLVIKNTHFISEYFPCDKLSGDFYDIYKIDDENIGMYILDVSGHGISAALMTMFCNNYIRSTERLIMRFRGLKPHKNLANFFEEFNKMNFPDEMHMVVFFASYNMTTKKLTYCSGGMNCIPFVVSEDGHVKLLDDSEGFAICKLNDIFTPEYKSANVVLKTGDRVLFYTDGLVDKEKNQVFTQTELEQVFKDGQKLTLRQMNERIVARIYPNSSILEDDITYFIMEV
jgi:sigma-B regulation protein RsbU (phosphoserine phosphatase)